MKKFLLFLATMIWLISCEQNQESDSSENPQKEIYTLGLVVHIIHNGEPIGEGSNLSDERIYEQIEVLNANFKERHQTKIEFRLAQYAPDTKPTTGIHRIDNKDVDIVTDNTQLPFDWLPQYGYWDPAKYINIWVIPLQPNIFLGSATMPTCDLPGLEKEVTTIGEGIMINTHHFGVSDVNGSADLGKTLVHEMGHFLGLEHLWGKQENEDCYEYDDYVDDTPPVTERSKSCQNIRLACDNQEALIMNFMDYIPDSCMNSFTEGQISRMRYAIANSKNRLTLISANSIDR